MRRIILGITAAAIAVSAVAAPALASNKPGTMTITDIVVGSSSFDVLQSAVVEAGLAGALDGTDQYTVFAPTDAAFVSTFEGILQADLSEQDVIDFIEAGNVDAAFGDGALVDILLYHVTDGRRQAKSVVKAPGYDMLNGDRLSRGELFAAGVIDTDISASNGVIHVIGGVLLP
jgi:uncharacterized surface protein with fasciclin (FAS1) repeats